MDNAVYPAGPDVFDPKHEAIFAERATLCRRLGLESLIPEDNRAVTATDIFSFNVDLLQQAGGVIANITPFRGPHCDVGTAWELGYAFAHDIPIFAFSTDKRLLVEKVEGALKAGRDLLGRAVEPFRLAEKSHDHGIGLREKSVSLV